MKKAAKLGHLVVAILIATEFQTLVAAASTAKPAAKRAAKPAVKPAPKPVAPVVIPKSPVTFSITSRIRHGSLVVSLDGIPVFNEEFEKPAFLLSQTTTWDPVQVAAGKHKLTAKVRGKKGKMYQSEIYDLEVSRTNGIELRIRMKGDTLTFERES